MISVWKRCYGEGPLHLLGQLAVFALAGYAASQVFGVASTHRLNLVLWFVAGALLHDVLFLPAYLVLDLLARLGLQDNPLRRVRAVNHVRFPAVVSGVLFLTTFPLILGKGKATFERTSGEVAPDYVSRWLLVSALAFLASAVAYAVRLRLDARRQAAPAAPGPAGGDTAGSVRA